MNDREATRGVLGLIPYGLYVVGSLHGSRAAAMVANWVTQVSFSPPRVAIAIEADSRMRSCVSSSGYFSVNVLPAGSRQTAKAFLKGPEAEGGTIGGKSFAAAAHGTPFLLEASGAVECRVTHTVDLADHIVFIGEVVDAVLRREGGEVLTLKETGWRYHR